MVLYEGHLFLKEIHRLIHCTSLCVCLLECIVYTFLEFTILLSFNNLLIHVSMNSYASVLMLISFPK